MSRHSFDPEIANQVGANAAVIFQNICYWCEHNAIKRKNFHEGNFWTYNSVKEISTFFPYFTGKQVRLALEKLESSGLIETGNFNKEVRDRTKWYALHRSGELFGKLVAPHLPERSEPTIAQKGKALPDIKPDIKHTPIVPKGTDLFNSNSQQESEIEPKEDPIDVGFEEFWNEIWPSHSRKTGKADCAKVYRSACKGKHKKADKVAPDVLNRCAKAYVASKRGDLTYLKGTLAWLRQPGWEPYLNAVALHQESDLTPRQRTMLQRGRVPPSMQDESGHPNEAARYWLKRYGYGKAA